MILGQIYTNYKNIDTNDFITITNNKSELNNKIPTLIVGKKNACEIIGESNLKFLDRKVNDKLFWTFGKTERRDEFEKDIKKFNDIIISKLLKDVSYKYVNIFTASYTEIKEILKIIELNKKKTYFIFENTLYLYYNKIIYGVSLNELEYIGIRRKRLFEIIQRNYYNKSVKAPNLISKKLRNVLKNSVFLVPYIYFLEKYGDF